MQLKVEDLTFAYKCGRNILRSVNFEVNDSEVVGLIAPSGYGKTTLAKILAKIIEPQEGKVLIDGKPIPENCYNPVQLVLQHPEKAVNPKWKMKKVLSEVREFNDEEIHGMGISPEWLERFPEELSGGELQRFCVLRVLNENTKFIIADEMTTMLDTITQAQIWNVVLDYAKSHNIGIVAISHEHDLLDKICTRIVDLSEVQGEINPYGIVR